MTENQEIENSTSEERELHENPADSREYQSRPNFYSIRKWRGYCFQRDNFNNIDIPSGTEIPPVVDELVESINQEKSKLRHERQLEKKKLKKKEEMKKKYQIRKKIKQQKMRNQRRLARTRRLEKYGPQNNESSTGQKIEKEKPVAATNLDPSAGQLEMNRAKDLQQTKRVNWSKMERKEELEKKRLLKKKIQGREMRAQRRLANSSPIRQRRTGLGGNYLQNNEGPEEETAIEIKIEPDEYRSEVTTMVWFPPNPALVEKSQDRDPMESVKIKSERGRELNGETTVTCEVVEKGYIQFSSNDFSAQYPSALTVVDKSGEGHLAKVKHEIVDLPDLTLETLQDDLNNYSNSGSDQVHSSLRLPLNNIESAHGSNTNQILFVQLMCAPQPPAAVQEYAHCIRNEYVEPEILQATNDSNTPSDLAIPDSIENYCQTIVKNCPNDQLQCSICFAVLRIHTPPTNTSVRMHNILNHAINHLEKQLFSCGHCDCGFNSPTSMKNHLRKHQLKYRSANCVNNMPNHIEAIIEIIKRCYDSEGNRTKYAPIPQEPREIFDYVPPSKLVPVRVVKKPMNPIGKVQSLSWKLLNQFEQDRQIWCRICKKFVSVKSSRPIIDHATNTHMKLPLFYCKRCPLTCGGLRQIVDHLRRRHKISASGNYEDDSKKYEDDVMKVLADCYDQNLDEKSIETSDCQIISPSEACSSNSSQCEETSKEAQQTQSVKKAMNPIGKLQSLSWKLRKQFGKDEQLKCRICETLVSAKTTRSIIDHAAHNHSELPLFSCKQCTYTCGGPRLMTHHLKRIHKLSSTGNYVNNNEKYEDDVMKVLIKCYDQNLNEKSVETSDSRMVSSSEARIRGASNSSQCEETSKKETQQQQQSVGSKSTFRCKFCSFITHCEKFMKGHFLAVHADNAWEKI